MNAPASKAAFVEDAVIQFHIAVKRARWFGLHCKAKLPAMDGEQSRQAAAFNSDRYWSGHVSREERDATAEEIDRACRAYFTKGRVSYTLETNNGAKRLRRAILARDGDACWLCGKVMPTQDRTIEHLVARSNGGTNELSNLALAHRACNHLLGNLPFEAKQALRARMRELEAA